MKQLIPSTIIHLVGLGSPAHYAIWNDLSCETLAGDLRGFFGGEVTVNMSRLTTQAGLPNLLKTIKNIRPAIIGLSLQSGSLELADQLVELLIKCYASNTLRPLLVLGNQLATYFPNELLKRYLEYENILVVRGEGELAFRGIVKYVQGNMHISEIDNLVYHDKALNQNTENRWVTPSLDSLLYLPALDTCFEISRRGGNVMVQGSRGCPWGNCSFCTRSSFRRGKGWEGFSPQRIAAHLSSLIQIGLNEFEFCDDEFFGGRSEENISRIKELVLEISRLNSRITFRIFTKPDILYRPLEEYTNKTMINLLEDLKRVGLTRVYLGIESGSPSQLKRYCKGVTVEQCENAISIIRKLDIGLDIGFIMFDPSLTVVELLQNIEFFKRNGLKSNNQWPFRPLVLNAGCKLSTCINDFNVILGAVDINHISYKYMYKDVYIQYINDIVNNITPSDGPYARLMYALKVLSKKHFAPNKRTGETDLAQYYIEKHCEIFLNLLDELATTMIHSALRQDIPIVKAVHKAIIHLNQLIFCVEKSLQDGQIADNDKYLIEQLINYKRNPLQASDVIPFPANEDKSEDRQRGRS